MTTTILHPQETAVLRSVAKSAAVLFTLMFIERTYPGRVSSELEIAAILRMDTRTVHRQLSGLSAAGLVTAQGADRWLLTPEGRGTLFPETLGDPVLSVEENDNLLLASESAAQIVYQIEDRLVLNSAKNVSSSSSDLDCTNCAEKIKQILRAAAALFDQEIAVHDVMLNREPEFVLGWIAKAYADWTRPASTLQSPASLIYRRLLDLTLLPVMYQKNPVRGLPAEFLREIGMETEAQLQDAVEAGSESRIVDYSAGAWSGLMKSTDPEERIAPFEGWVTVFRNLPKIQYVAFHGGERVEVTGATMRVYLRESPSQDRVIIANKNAADIASQVYAELIGDPSARVEFFSEVAA